MITAHSFLVSRQYASFSSRTPPHHNTSNNNTVTNIASCSTSITPVVAIVPKKHRLHLQLPPSHFASSVGNEQAGDGITKQKKYTQYKNNTLCTTADKAQPNARVRPGPSTFIMPKRKESGNLSPLSRSPPLNATPDAISTPAVAHSKHSVGAVEIPVKPRHSSPAATAGFRAHFSNSANRRHSPNGSGTPRRQAMLPSDVMSPSVAALLAVTTIPSQKKRAGLRKQRSSDSRNSSDSSRKGLRMTVDSIVPKSRVSEKELSDELSYASSSRTPMDVLLSPPEELVDEDSSIASDGGYASPFSTRAESCDSLPSMSESTSTSLFAPSESPFSVRSRIYRQPRRSLEPLPSPPGQEPCHHPLYVEPESEDRTRLPVDDDPDITSIQSDSQFSAVFMPLKDALKSNLTASIRALRSAARSLSTFTASSVPSQDLFTRSMLTMDSRMPFTDERRPPVLEDEPSEWTRRYLNPTDGARLDGGSRGARSTRSFTASIQMQTYKIQRSRTTTPSRVSPSAPPPSPPKTPVALTFPPGPRQREIRENPDFIRIAVMEHLMRKRGKLDDQREGHAKWLLPPRRASLKPYEVGADGIPVRWLAMPPETV